MFARLNEIFHEGSEAGLSSAAMARMSGSNEQHIRNVLKGRNTYEAEEPGDEERGADLGS